MCGDDRERSGRLLRPRREGRATSLTLVPDRVRHVQDHELEQCFVLLMVKMTSVVCARRMWLGWVVVYCGWCVWYILHLETVQQIASCAKNTWSHELLAVFESLSIACVVNGV